MGDLLLRTIARAARSTLLLALGLAGACAPGPVGNEGEGGADGVRGSARLRARPGTPTDTLAPGTHALGLGFGRDGLLHVPAGYRPEAPAPLIVFLHGAGGSARNLEPLFELADSVGAVVLVPESRSGTWDGISGTFGPDVRFLDRALEHVFAGLSVDPRRVAVSGFSDGGSYALSVGLANGDLFSHVIAFSPGFMFPPNRTGKPPVFVAHGTRDAVLPIDVTSRRIVRELTGSGYEVRYEEFDGPHVISLAVVRRALEWMLGEE